MKSNTSNVSPNWLLAIDTSTSWTGAAVFNGAAVDETAWHAGRDQTVSVLAAIDGLMQRQKLEPGQLQAIGVTIGPGMFSSVRVGLSIAKGMAWSLDLPVIGVSSLQVTALPYLETGMPVIAVVAAGRERLVWSSFPPGCSAGTPPRNGALDELLHEALLMRQPVLVTGELTALHKEILHKVPGVQVPGLSGRLRRPTALAELAWQRWQANDLDDAATIDAIYLHATNSSAVPAGR